jgi:hypothetical protein
MIKMVLCYVAKVGGGWYLTNLTGRFYISSDPVKVQIGGVSMWVYPVMVFGSLDPVVQRGDRDKGTVHGAIGSEVV